MSFNELLEVIKQESIVYIQTHDFPDHDAVASAFALQYLLNSLHITAKIIYEGDLQRDSLKQMVDDLHIEIKHSRECQLTEKDRIIIVDGCKYNKNVTDLVGEEIGIIDHHQVQKPDDVPYADIRSDYGACSTIMLSYLVEYRIVVPTEVATALLIGINMDTSLLTRGVSKNDIEAYAYLYDLSDIHLQNSILRNYIQTKDLSFYKYAIDHVEISSGLAICYFPEGCNQNLLGILGDFFLALEEVDFVFLFARNDGKVNFSVRNENRDINAAEVIQKVLFGIGFGGGHADMAGGIMTHSNDFDQKLITERLYKELEVSR